ncbi:hypothetical protein [Streptomyces sp. RM99]|uniref:hypothetical protein n=1 Tax=Streptomyces TaxID=1883 RepID=UPI001B36E1AE|nr:hypothetical protein [Streptomyces sp. RM99]MBQ0914754.1 hypothetical protein [Streptomyces sp. RM99]
MELTCRLGGIEDTCHAIAVKDLQKGSTQEVARLAIAGQDIACELAAGHGQTLPVCVGGRTAHMLAVAEGFFVLGEDFDRRK